MTADKSAVEALADECAGWHGSWRLSTFADALREAIAADRAAGRLVTPTEPSRADIEALIEASSLGTPEAKAARESVPPEIGIAIAKAAEYLVRAEKAERERDDWKRIAETERDHVAAPLAQRAETAYARGRDEALAEVEERLGSGELDMTFEPEAFARGFWRALGYSLSIIRELRKRERE